MRPKECQTCKAHEKQIEFLKQQVIEKDIFIRELSLVSTKSLQDYAYPTPSPLQQGTKEIEKGLIRIFDPVTGEGVEVPSSAIGVDSG